MIIRSENKDRFTVISNELLNDNRITDKALGTLVRLLSKPDNWNLNINHLVKTGKQGRTAIRSSIAELEKAGYIHRRVTRGKSGRITGTEYLIYEQAVSREEALKDLPRDEHKRAPARTSSPWISPNMEKSIPQGPQVEHGQTAPMDETGNQENQSRKNRSQETAPITNTNNKQTLRVTTTTTPAPSAEVAIEGEVEQSPQSSYPATGSLDYLFNTIPKQHQQPMVKALVNRALGVYSIPELQEAIAYSSAKVRGGSMQYKAYLDKTLKNQWATGYLEAMVEQPSTPDLFSPGGFTGGRYPNGTITGSTRMDTNYAVCLDFAREMKLEMGVAS
ncbi:MAG: hypothetical protein JEZ12_11840 [Desulfobacterium sp.]|nr:hypothetical protein [Desulfobacterium sp.]